MRFRSSITATAGRRTACALLACILSADGAPAQSVSNSAIRFFGTGVGPPGQQDRIRIRIDDNSPGADASAPCDVGSGSFSLDFWIRGLLAENPATGGGGRREYFDFRWIEGNIVVDRDTWGDSSRDWGVSLAGGLVRFGTGRADASPIDQEHTLEGGSMVLNGAWRHIAVVRDAATGIKSIYVDGVLDFASPPGRSFDDISYPNQGVSGKVTPWCPFMVLGAEQHDAGAAYPSFSGYMDEVRVWNVALSPAQVAARFQRVLPPGTPGLVAAFRLEEGSGTSVADSSGAASPTGQLIAGTPGNGEWVLRASNPANTAPVTGCAGDFNADGAASAQDVFDFLSAFFANDPRADVNHSGAVTAQDVFDFLAAFFAGCA